MRRYKPESLEWCRGKYSFKAIPKHCKNHEPLCDYRPEHLDTQSESSPEQKLLLTNIIHAIQGHLNGKEEETEYIFNPSCPHVVFGFNWCCEHCDIDPEIVREELIKQNPVHRAKGVKIGTIIFDYPSPGGTTAIVNSKALKSDITKPFTRKVEV